MSLHLVKMKGMYVNAAKCAVKAAGLYRGDSSSMMSLVGLCLVNGSEKEAKRAAIKAIHCYPQNLEPWSVLLSTNAANQRILQNAKAVMNSEENKQDLQEWIKQLKI